MQRAFRYDAYCILQAGLLHTVCDSSTQDKEAKVAFLQKAVDVLCKSNHVIQANSNDVTSDQVCISL